MSSTSATFELDGLPRATATYDSVSGRISVVVDNIDGLASQRIVSNEETSMGIDSLSPPTAHGNDVRSVIDRTVLAVSAAVDSTLGNTMTPPEILWCRYRAVVSVKGALNALGLAV